MWKWTDSDHIRAIILDADSLDNEFFKFPYEQYIPEVKVFPVKDIWNFNNIHYECIEYYDISFLLQEVLLKAKCDSYSVISISSNPLFLKDMMQNHIGTILIGDLKKDFLKNTPDFTHCSLESLPNILSNKRTGYGAEVYATYSKARRTMSLLRCESEIKLDNGVSKRTELYFGGRYYADKHQYLLNDPLSVIVKGFKYQYIKTIDLFLDSAIEFIRKKEKVDILTYIPLKPKDIEINKFDRFSSLKLDKNSKDGLTLHNVLLCKKDFSQKGNDLFVRKEIVKGAFEVTCDITGKNIVIIDDVFSTGSTMFEAMKTLYEAGANKVIAIFLAVNQLTESSSISYKNLICPYCGGSMELKMNSKSGQMFFGCKEYKSHPEEKYTIAVDKGLNLLKERNKLEVTDVIDLQDEY